MLLISCSVRMRRACPEPKLPISNVGSLNFNQSRRRKDGLKEILETRDRPPVNAWKGEVTWDLSEETGFIMGTFLVLSGPALAVHKNKHHFKVDWLHHVPGIERERTSV